MKKTDLLHTTVDHYDIKTVNVVPMIDMMEKTAFQARNLARAAKIVDEMVADKDCGIILTLAGSLISAGQKGIILDMMRCNMVDAIVSTGANIVDQDFFEALGYRHYQGSPFASDNDLRERHIDRIYDTYINEDELRICDDTIREISEALEPRAYSSREFIMEMGKHLDKKFPKADSIVLEAYRRGIPIVVPAFSDCSAGFGLVFHQVSRRQAGKPYVAIDSVADFRELTQIKIESGVTGLIMLGGGVPKNFVQDIVVSAEFLGYEADMHKYAVQLTVADERDGALSGSTLKEANSWGKVDLAKEQMVFGEATVTFPLIAGYAYHKGPWKNRKARNFAEIFSKPSTLKAEGYTELAAK
ncbi:MAG: deoxyhypusine synthase [Acidobacteriaceae bacterium]|nr:deoxyhypusine synthase [Acidobacteriaceae bacterium]